MAQMEFVDVFCGGGMMSYAARAAGMKVIWGVDNDSSALLTYKVNFPEAKIVCASVGPGADDEVAIPGAAPNRHIHLSPPCTQISSANAARRDKASGIAALKWSIQTAMSGYESWSIETVVSKSSHEIVKPLREAHKTDGLFDYAQIDAQYMGDPQTRKRLILGPKTMIAAIKAAPPCRIVTVREAFAREGVAIPPGTTHTKNASKSNHAGSNIRPIDHPSFTVCAARANSFCKANGKTTKSMTSEQSRVLMGFDSGFKLRGKAIDTQRVLGNGICFQVGRAIALSAQKKAITFPAQIRVETSSSKDSDSSSDEDEDGCVANDTLAACLDDMGKMAKRHAEDTERMAKRMRRLVVPESGVDSIESCASDPWYRLLWQDRKPVPSESGNM